VPYTFDLLQQAPFQGRQTLPTLRRVTQAGGRLAADRVRQLARDGQREGWDFFVMYGQTEATARMAYLPPCMAAEHPDCVGVAIPGGALRIDDGEVVFAGPNVMMGYAHCPQDLARGRETTELRTGDLGEITAEGLLRITGRVANRAKVYGLRIDLDHVESLVPGAVALVIDSTLVIATEGPTRGLRADVSRRTGLPECAVHVERLAIPRLASGKPDRPALAATVRLPEAVVSGDAADDVKRALATTLRRPVRDGDSFVSLGGDSLAYVAASVRLERILGDLPRGWHLLTVSELVEAARPRCSRLSLVETSVVLRAAAVLLVVGSHTGLFDIRGGAHLLLGLAGYNFARFVLPASDRLAVTGRALAGFVIPVALWLTLVVATSKEYGASVFGVTFSDLPGDDPAWRYWFVEVFALCLLIAAASVVPRSLARLERVWPVGFAAGLLGAAVGLRELLVPATLPGALFTISACLWVFALGWLLAVIPHDWRARAAASAAVVVLVVPFFENPTRDVVIGLGLLLLVWVPSVRLPRPVVGLLGAIAGASLIIYLTHWQSYPPFAQWPALATVVALLFGVAVHAGLRRIGLMR
jgi:hypothetical protein